jgi:hypothetical protein
MKNADITSSNSSSDVNTLTRDLPLLVESDQLPLGLHGIGEADLICRLVQGKPKAYAGEPFLHLGRERPPPGQTPSHDEQQRRFEHIYRGAI